MTLPTEVVGQGRYRATRRAQLAEVAHLGVLVRHVAEGYKQMGLTSAWRTEPGTGFPWP